MHRLVLACCLLALAIGSGCGKNQKPARPAPLARTTDALWALAPAGTRLGVVVAPGTGTLLAVAWAELERSATRWRMVQPWLAALRAQAPAEVFDDGARARMGLDIARGAALFMISEDELALVLPVVDRAAFRQRAGGVAEDVGGVAVDTGVMGGFRCREIAGRYACASSDALLAAMGGSDALARRIAERPAELRGAIELEADMQILDAGEREDLAGVFPGLTVARAAVQLADGALTVRVHGDGSTAGLGSAAMSQVPATLARRAAETPPSGFVKVSVPMLAQGAVELVSRASENTGIELDARALEELTGEVLFTGAAGDMLDVSVQLGARNGARMQTLVTQLCRAIQGQGLPVSVRMDGERCVFRIEPALLALASSMSELAVERPLELALGASDAALALRVTIDGPTAAAASADMSPLGRELLAGDWSFALWSHGTALRNIRHMPLLNPAALTKVLSSEGRGMFELAAAMLWLSAHVAEIGAGVTVREDGTHAVLHVATQWANPDQVVREYHEMLERMVASVDIQADFAALAGRHRDTLLGRSYENGSVGMMSVTATLGMLAAVAIPAFQRYMELGKSTEAKMFIKWISDGALAHYHNPPFSDASTPAPKHFPPESVGPTPPVGACCMQGGKCAPDPALWEHPTWRALGFSIEDPHYYSYQYEVLDGGKAFVARAIGDLDCDGVLATFELSGTVTDDGRVQMSPEIRQIDENE